MPHIDWKSYFPKFKYEKGDDDAFHLIKFNMHIHKLGVDFHEDFLMRMFMVTLEEKARSWYEGLSLARIYYLKDFYTIFCKNYKYIYSSTVLVETFCGDFDNLLQRLGIDIDDECMSDEIKEALYEFLSQHQ